MLTSKLPHLQPHRTRPHLHLRPLTTSFPHPLHRTMPSLPPPHHHHPKPLSVSKATSFPDFIFAALSFVFLFSTGTSTKSLPLLPPKFSLIFPQSSSSRKFLRNPNMSIPNRNPNFSPKFNPNPNSRRFSNPQALADWLRPRMPSDTFAAWGVQPGTKNVHNLWLEMAEGESMLEDSTPPVRTVQVVTVRIIDGTNRVLVESHQELSDGTVRYRGRPLSEKMKPGETVDCAVSRAIKEELGSVLYIGFVCEEGRDGLVRIVPDSYVDRVEERVSASYPGLPACYVLHTVDARVDVLPEGDFWTEEDQEYEESSKRNVADQAVSVKRHYWKWVDSDKDDSVHQNDDDQMEEPDIVLLNDALQHQILQTQIIVTFRDLEGWITVPYWNAKDHHKVELCK